MQNRPFSPEVIFSSIPALLPYLLVTLEVGLISILTGSILGMLLAWAKLSSHKVLRCAADGYTYVIRCTPSIVLLFIVFYGLPKWMEFAFAIDIDDFIARCLCDHHFHAVLRRLCIRSFPFGLSGGAERTVRGSCDDRALSAISIHPCHAAAGGRDRASEFWKFCDQSFERKRAGIHDRTHRSFGKDESDHCQKLWRIWDRTLHSEHDPILGAVDRD